MVLNEGLSRADAVVCLEGDGQKRAKKALEIFKAKWAPIIVVSGGYDNPPFSIKADKMAEYLIKKNTPKEKIIIESKSKNTSEQAMEVMKIIKNNNWGKIILVASDFHQARAYLTFLRAMDNARIKIIIINAPAKRGPLNADLTGEEFKKIKEYEKKGHTFSYSEL